LSLTQSIPAMAPYEPNRSPDAMLILTACGISAISMPISYVFTLTSSTGRDTAA
jgi:hypothetical protein